MNNFFQISNQVIIKQKITLFYINYTYTTIMCYAQNKRKLISYYAEINGN